MNEQLIPNIKHQYKILKELHGSLQRDELVSIISKDFNVDIIDVHNAINSKTEDATKEYGLVIMRAQPFHIAHQNIINQIILDGKIPLILLGDDCGADINRNPLSVEERKTLIKLIYPTECIIEAIKDKDDWNAWFDQVGHIVIGTSGRHRDQITLYTHRKEQDKCDFVYDGKKYINESYPALFEDADIRVKDLDIMSCSLNQEIHGTNIRKNEEVAKIHLDARIYLKLKEWNWWLKPNTSLS